MRQVVMEYNRRQFGRVFGTVVGGFALAGWSESLIASTTESYLVRKGDTLWSIANKFGLGVRDLKSQNGLSSSVIHVGQRLRIPGLTSTIRWNIGHPGVKRSKWKRIIVHHSGTAVGDAKSFHNFHKRKMENGLAYHFVICNGSTKTTRDGQIEVGPRWKRQIQGGHVRGLKYNANSVGICLVGNFEKTRPTAKQLDALNKLTQYLHVNLFSKRTTVIGHKDLQGQKTVCPGKYFPLKAYRSRFA